MTKQEVVNKILSGKNHKPLRCAGYAFAPVNIALVKYWGKRDAALNLPVTNSLSVALGDKGAYTLIAESDSDKFIINGVVVSAETEFHKKLKNFLDLFRVGRSVCYQVESEVNVPVAAGLASSACGFAALVKALDKLYDWRLSYEELAILARLGSGSACRSLQQGFVEWQAGNSVDGMDSFGVPVVAFWSELRVGLLIINAEKKSISSRLAMERTVATSKIYKDWSGNVGEHLKLLKQAIANKDFCLLGATAEANSEAMHKTIEASVPTITFTQKETLAAIIKVKELRQQGISVYFTQDAGPNLKLLFLTDDTSKILAVFPQLEIVTPFVDSSEDQVILVDEQDRDLGVMEKLAAHKAGKLHRAFSIFVYRKVGNTTEILLQQRRADKYHSGGLWTNACCSHPRPGEDILTAANRRLQEEMGLDVDLFPQGKFYYRADFSDGLTEHEMDYVLAGETNLEPVFNKQEVQDTKWIEISKLQSDLKSNPDKYTAWFGLAFSYFIKRLSDHCVFPG